MSYEYISLLKASEKGDIRLVRDDSGRLFVQRYRNIDRGLAEKLMGMRCPYIARVISVGEDEDGAYTIEEYVEGTPASEMDFTREQAVNILFELCAAIKALHRAGIVHRDLKPSNIIVDKQGHAHLIDFDVARIIKEYQKHDTGYLGTTGYAPPEQYGFMQTDCRSDIYAFGRTMEELLGADAEKRPFVRIIRRCTAFDPEKRYSDIVMVEIALKHSRISALAIAAVSGVTLLAAAAVILVLCMNGHRDGDTASSVKPSAPVSAEQGVIVTAEDILTTEESAVSVENIVSAEDVTASGEEVTSQDEADTLSSDTMSFETVQDENGRYYDRYEYVFYDDAALHGSWCFFGTSRDGKNAFGSYVDLMKDWNAKYITVHSDGTMTMLDQSLRELAPMRWTNGYYIDERTDIHKVQEMYLVIEESGRELLFLEIKPMGNGDDKVPHMYVVFERV